MDLKSSQKEIVNMNHLKPEETSGSQTSEETKKQARADYNKNLHHPFDNKLANTFGDITIVMKICTDQVLALKVL